MKQTIIKAIDVVIALVGLAQNFTIPANGLWKLEQALLEARRTAEELEDR